MSNERAIVTRTYRTSATTAITTDGDFYSDWYSASAYREAVLSVKTSGTFTATSLDASLERSPDPDVFADAIPSSSITQITATDKTETIGVDGGLDGYVRIKLTSAGTTTITVAAVLTLKN